MDMSVVNTLNIIHVDDPGLYIPTEKNILIIIQAANALVKSYHKPAPLYVSTFYRRARALLDELHICDMKEGEKKFPTFEPFSNKHTADKEHSPYNNVPVHYHDAFFWLRRRGQVEKVVGEGWDVGEACAFKRIPPLLSRWQHPIL